MLFLHVTYELSLFVELLINCVGLKMSRILLIVGKCYPYVALKDERENKHVTSPFPIVNTLIPSHLFLAHLFIDSLMNYLKSQLNIILDSSHNQHVIISLELCA